MPVGATFSVPVQTGPGAHPASCTVDTVSVPKVERPGRGDDHPPHLAPRLKKEYSNTYTPPLGLCEPTLPVNYIKMLLNTSVCKFSGMHGEVWSIVVFWLEIF
jgi:hypothetical protein